MSERPCAEALPPDPILLGIYLNNAATTYPKPRSVNEAVWRSLVSAPNEPGRGGGGRDPVDECRCEIARLFHVREPRQVVLTPSATFALNTVLWGLLGGARGGHCLSTVLEHNSVLRPLEHLRQSQHVDVTLAPAPPDGQLDPLEFLSLVRSDTQLIAVTHASNVTGCVQPVDAIAHQAASLGIPMLIDASQSAGAIPLDYGQLPGRVFVAFAGHKGLYGPTGVGGLLVPDARLPQTIVGGTGVHSDSLVHPAALPLRHEAGTMNLPGIAGLTAGVRFVCETGVLSAGQHRQQLVSQLRRQLAALPDIRLAPLPADDGRAGIVSFTLRGWDAEDVGFLLRESFGIDTRSGLHCAPLIHHGLGTWPTGSVRVSVGAFNTPDDIDQLVAALTSIVGVPCAA